MRQQLDHGNSLATPVNVVTVANPLDHPLFTGKSNKETAVIIGVDGSSISHAKKVFEAISKLDNTQSSVDNVAVSTMSSVSHQAKLKHFDLKPDQVLQLNAIAESFNILGLKLSNSGKNSFPNWNINVDGKKIGILSWFASNWELEKTSDRFDNYLPIEPDQWEEMLNDWGIVTDSDN